MRIVFCVVFTIVGLFLAFVNSIESPIRVGENNAIKFIGLLNLLWLIPYIIFYFWKKRFTELKKSFLLYIVCLIPFAFLRLYRRSFDENKWRTEVNYNKRYGNNPAHMNGDMVEDIIESKILVGLSKKEIETKLGTNYFSDPNLEVENMLYFYSNRNIFEGCDKLLIKIKDGRCFDTGYMGCD
jgi:hypothetical protein